MELIITREFPILDNDMVPCRPDYYYFVSNGLTGNKSVRKKEMRGGECQCEVRRKLVSASIRD